jgi:PAS domain S-box-containing protein
MQEAPQKRMKRVKKVPASAAGTLDFLSGAGEMARRIRKFDWTQTDLGPPMGWSMPLKTLLGLMLSSVQPMFMAWGPKRTWLYNDAFIPILGNKHPGALGRPALGEVWLEAADTLAPLFAKVFGGEPVHMEDFKIMLDRKGRLEEAHFAYSYTPVRDDNGDVIALFGACQEITERTLAERQRVTEQERQRRAFEQAPGFVIVMRGPEHTVEFVNDAHRRLFASHEWTGKTIRQAFPGLADRASSNGWMQSMQRAKRLKPGEQTYATGRRPARRKKLAISISSMLRSSTCTGLSPASFVKVSTSRKAARLSRH